MAFHRGRRDFIALFGGAAATSPTIRPLAAQAQQRAAALPVVAFINGGSADASASFATTISLTLPRTIPPSRIASSAASPELNRRCFAVSS